MNRYRIVRIGEAYRVQKWYDKSWFWKAGWYTYKSFGDSPWSANISIGYKFPAIEKAQEHIRQLINVDCEIMEDHEPAGGFPEVGEQLRAKYLENPMDDGQALVYADWLDENGYEKSAKRIRTLVYAYENAMKESGLR